jgi:hypothetical protein
MQDFKKHKVQMSKSKCQINDKVQNQSIIPPRPPLAKGGWGDLTIGFWISFGIWALTFDIIWASWFPCQP